MRILTLLEAHSDETRGSRFRLAGFFAAALFVTTTAAAGPPEERIWITLGSEAFSTLRSRGEVAPGGRPLERVAERAGVVLTHVRRDDLARISGTLHREHQVCAGFVAHPGRDRAMEVLAAAGGSPRRDSIDYAIDQPELVEHLSSLIQEHRILATIRHLSEHYTNRYYQHRSGRRAATWIGRRWRAFAGGRRDVQVDLWHHDEWLQPSVVLTIEGSTHPDEVVVLGGHIDSILTPLDGGESDPRFIAPGADDNASGIAVLTELARIVLGEDFAPQRTVKFIAYAAEEVGLLGSQEIARSFAESGAKVVGVLQLDMTGFHGSVEDIAFVSDFTSSDLTNFLADLVDTYQPELEWTTTECGYACSDHASWHLEGYPAAFAFEARFGEFNPAIHTPGDTLSAMGHQASHASKFARLAMAFLVEASVGDPR